MIIITIFLFIIIFKLFNIKYTYNISKNQDFIFDKN